MSDGGDDPSPQERRLVVGVAAATLLGAALRVLDLTRFDLWFDEAATWHYARLAAAGQLAEQMRLEPTPPLYYALVGWTMRLAGDTDAAMRAPSVVFGALAVAASAWLVYRLFAASGRRFAGLAALWSAVFVAVHPLLVFLGREARVYPLLALEALLLAVAVRRALDDDRMHQWALVTLLATLACYSHFYGMFLAASAGVVCLLLGAGWRVRLRGFVAAALAGVLFAPYVWATLPSLKASGAAWSVEAFYRSMPEERGLGRVLEGQAIGAKRHGLQRQLATPPPAPWLRALALGLQALLVLAALAAGRMLARRGREALVLVLSFWSLPVLVPWAITHWVGRPIFQSGRHDAFVVPFACIVLAIGLAHLQRLGRTARGAAVLAATVLVAIAALRLAWLHETEPQRAPSRLGVELAATVDAGDEIVALGIRRLLVERYLRRAGSAHPIRSFPASTDRHPGWADPHALARDPQALRREADAYASALAGRLEAGETAQIFLLARDYGTPDDPAPNFQVDRHLFTALETRGWRPIDEWPELRVLVLVPPGPASEDSASP
ncbi:MAG: glycosyltransferase family 39 protein [Acidobacteriota bacterium]